MQRPPTLHGPGQASAWLLAVAVLAGCATPPPDAPSRRPPPIQAGRDGPPSDPPAQLDQTPDAEPRVETIRPGGPNKPYEVYGESYIPLPADAPLTERGLASWYGRKFHGRRTASGETYNMYAMTAAHKTMPIPSYARVRNPGNGREVLVRVNDRGPFVAGRIIDLSYTAALKLGMLGGVGAVEVERILPEDIRAGRWRRGEPDATRLAAAPAAPAPAAEAAGDAVPAPTGPAGAPGMDVGAAAVAAVPLPAPVPPPAATGLVVESRQPTTARAYTQAGAGFWVQIGAFRQAEGAQRFQQSVAQNVDWLAPLLTVFADSGLHRLQAGPYPNRGEARDVADRVRQALQLEPVVLERR